ncbi:MAG TPA: alpha/beta fold hydrolase [Geminicoccaceae bacterium]|nr:alpha/beta fold hydrolase [Geminicoccaceae bacterium]
MSAVARGPARRPAPPPVRAPALGDGVLIARDGARLPLAAWLPPVDEPGALLLGLHNFGDYRAAFNLLGPWFAGRGVAVYAYDQRGFGATEARGTWAGAEAMTRDLGDAIRALRLRHGSRPPLYVVGESMGGAVALAALGLGAAAGIDGLILAAPGVREGAPLRHAQDVGLWVGASTVPWVSFGMERGGRPWQHPAEAARLATDPLVLREVRVDTWWGLVELANLASDHAGAVTAPTLLIYGERDTTIHKIAIDRLAKRLGGPLTTIRYPTRYHLPLHERDPEEVFADVLAWLDWRRGVVPPERRLVTP